MTAAHVLFGKPLIEPIVADAIMNAASVLTLPCASPEFDAACRCSFALRDLMTVDQRARVLVIAHSLCGSRLSH